MLTPVPIYCNTLAQNETHTHIHIRTYTQAGVCYHLYPTGAHEQMNEYQLAEILRTPLEELCLQVMQRGAVCCRVL